MQFCDSKKINKNVLIFYDICEKTLENAERASFFYFFQLSKQANFIREIDICDQRSLEEKETSKTSI